MSSPSTYCFAYYLTFLYAYFHYYFVASLENSSTFRALIVFSFLHARVVFLIRGYLIASAVTLSILLHVLPLLSKMHSWSSKNYFCNLGHHSVSNVPRARLLTYSPAVLSLPTTDEFLTFLQLTENLSLHRSFLRMTIARYHYKVDVCIFELFL